MTQIGDTVAIRTSVIKPFTTLSVTYVNVIAAPIITLNIAKFEANFDGE